MRLQPYRSVRTFAERRLSTLHCLRAAMPLLVFVVLVSVSNGQWVRHTIDDTLTGADGAKLADANGDGFLDVATGWEESGRTCIYLHPGPKSVRDGKPWSRVLLGKTPSVEDAAWFDANRNGQLDVLASCEGKEQCLFLFEAPRDLTRLSDPAAWKTRTIAKSKGVTRWMFAAPLASPRQPPMVVLGSKSPNGQIAVLRPAADNNTAPELQRLVDASWIMSIVPTDVDGDGDTDVIYSDRKGEQSGVYWLESHDGRFTRHLMGCLGEEVMFIDVAKTLDGRPRVYVPVKTNRIFELTQGPASQVRRPWEIRLIAEWDLKKFGRAKAVASGRLLKDAASSLVFSCEGADGDRSGVGIIPINQGQSGEALSISGPDGIKFDFVELVDLDYDGDLDILTCEERYEGRGLGIVWYENPI